MFIRGRKRRSGAQLRKAARLLKRGQTDEASAILDQVARDAADDPAITLDLGAIYYQMGRHSAAVTQFERATELSPEDPKAWLNLAAAHNSLGHIERAEAALSRLVELAPEYPDLHYNTAILLLKRRQPLKAMAELELELAVSPGHLLAQQLLEQLRKELIT